MMKAPVNGLINYFASLLPEELGTKETADRIIEEYPKKYPAGIPEDKRKEAVVGNTGFRTLYLNEKKGKLTYCIAIGDNQSSRAEFVLSNWTLVPPFYL